MHSFTFRRSSILFHNPTSKHNFTFAMQIRSPAFFAHWCIFLFRTAISIIFKVFPKRSGKIGSTTIHSYPILLTIVFPSELKNASRRLQGKMQKKLRVLCIKFKCKFTKPTFFLHHHSIFLKAPSKKEKSFPQHESSSRTCSMSLKERTGPKG